MSDEGGSSVALHRLRSSHLESLFDYTTKEDNPSNVIIDETFQFIFPENDDFEFGTSPSCYFSFGKASNEDSLNQHHSVAILNSDSGNVDTESLETKSERPMKELNYTDSEQDKKEVTMLHEKMEFQETIHSYTSPTVVQIPQKKPKSSMTSNDTVEMKSLSEEYDNSTSNNFVASGVQFHVDFDSTQPRSRISSDIATRKITNGDEDHDNNEFEDDEFGQFHEPPAVSNPIPEDPFANEILMAIPFAVEKQTKEQSHEADEFGHFHEPPVDVTAEPYDPFASEFLSAIPLAAEDQKSEQLHCNNDTDDDKTHTNFETDGGRVSSAMNSDFQPVHMLNNEMPVNESCNNPDDAQPKALISDDAAISRKSDNDGDLGFGQLHEPPDVGNSIPDDPFASTVLSAIPLPVVDQVKDQLHVENGGSNEETVGNFKTDAAITGNGNLHDAASDNQINANHHTEQPDLPISSEATIDKYNDDDEFEDDEFGQFHEPSAETSPKFPDPFGGEVLSMTYFDSVDPAKDHLHVNFSPHVAAVQSKGLSLPYSFGSNVNSAVSKLEPADLSHFQSNRDAKTDIQLASSLYKDHDTVGQDFSNVESTRLHSVIAAGNGTSVSTHETYNSSDSFAVMGSLDMHAEGSMKELNVTDFVTHENGGTLLATTSPTAVKIHQKKSQPLTAITTMRCSDVAQNSQKNDGISSLNNKIDPEIQSDDIFDNMQPDLPISSEANIRNVSDEDEFDDDEFGQFHEPPVETSAEPPDNPFGIKIPSMTPLDDVDKPTVDIHRDSERNGDEISTNLKTNSDDCSYTPRSVENVSFGSSNHTDNARNLKLTSEVDGSSFSMNIGDDVNNGTSKRRMATFTCDELTQSKTSLNFQASDVPIDDVTKQMDFHDSNKIRNELPFSCTQDHSLNEQNNIGIDAIQQDLDDDMDFGEFEAPPEDETKRQFGGLDLSNGKVTNAPTGAQHVDINTFQGDGTLSKPSLISELFSPIGREEMHLPLSLDQYQNSSDKHIMGASSEPFPVSVKSDDILRNQSNLDSSIKKTGIFCDQRNIMKDEDNSVSRLDGLAFSLQEQNHSSENFSGCESDDDSFGDFCAPTQ